jgi:large subunit ribosomal protein L17
MVTSLLKHERIKTTKARAREIRRYAEKMITIAKKETLASKRELLGFVREREVVNKLCKTLIYRYAQRQGGYTRILRLANRKGDGAEMVFLELVDRPVAVEAAPQPEAEKKEKPAAPAEPEAGTGKEKKKKTKAAAEKA